MRYKEYNTNKVLEQVLQLFWKKGFKGCSIKDLVEATGVNRFSFYEEFEDKNGMLYHSLHLYRERYADAHLKLLKQKGELKTVLGDFFLSYFDSERFHPGCYIIHIGTELADTDPKINTIVSDYMDELSASFSSLLVANAFNNEEADFLAKHLTALYCTSMSFCLIHSETERRHHIENGIAVLLNQHNHATSIT